MNMLPPAIATFSAILKNQGHQVQVFDTTYYAIDFVKIGSLQTSPALQIRTFYFYMAILIAPLFIGIYYLFGLAQLISEHQYGGE